jgi:hypothetical protein
MELKEQQPVSTLSSRLGEVPHVSGLLRRIAKESGAGDRVNHWLVKVAVERGAEHYRRNFDPSLPPDALGISDEEIGIALCLGEHPYALDQLRVAAQLLTSQRIDAERLSRLAVQERCEPVLLHIADVAERFAPELHPWTFIRQHLPPRSVSRKDSLPHWSRLVSHTGVSKGGGPPETQWLSRRE